jgi:hypothetical protein
MRITTHLRFGYYLNQRQQLEYQLASKKEI